MQDLVIHTDQQTEVIQFSQDRYFTRPDAYLWSAEKPLHTRNIFSGSLKLLQHRLQSWFFYIPQFSLYAGQHETKRPRVVNVIEVINIMRGDKLQEQGRQIKRAKEIGDEEQRRILKSRLPCITHSGVFGNRCNAGLTLPGFTYQLDIDNVVNADEILQQVINDKALEVLFASKSVSGNGVKAMIFLKPLLYRQDAWTHEEYRRLYHKATEVLQKYFDETYQVKIDPQMKAISQPFYLFNSPDLFIHKNLLPWI